MNKLIKSQFEVQWKPSPSHTWHHNPNAELHNDIESARHESETMKRENAAVRIINYIELVVE